MKKKKELTEPLACRVSEKMKSEIEEMAEILDYSLAQYVAILVEMGFNNPESKALQLRLDEIEAELQEKDRQLKKLQNLSLCLSPPFSEPLKVVQNNEKILRSLFTQYDGKVVPSTDLEKSEFGFKVMLNAERIDKKSFLFMGDFGWAFSDETKQFVTIKKRK